MARVVLPVTSVAREGIAWPPAEVNGDATNNHQVLNSDSKTVVVVRNSSSTTARTVTFRIPRLIDGQGVSPVTRSIPANATRAFGTFSADDYGTTLLIDVDHAELKLYAFRAI